MIDKTYYKTKEIFSFEDLIKIIHDLREPDGCPWDRAQTWESTNTCLLDEAYETVSAVRHDDPENVREELGDVLMQVIVYATIAKEQGLFTIEDVIDDACKKLVRRHPHVFEEEYAESPDAALARWEESKKQEKKSAKEAVKNELERVPDALPALVRAQKVLKKAKALGYTMPDTEGKEDMGNQLLKIALSAQESGISAEKVLTETVETYIKDVSKS